MCCLVSFDTCPHPGNHQKQQDNEMICHPKETPCHPPAPPPQLPPLELRACFLSLLMSVCLLEFHVNDIRASTPSCLVSLPRRHHFTVHHDGGAVWVAHPSWWWGSRPPRKGATAGLPFHRSTPVWVTPLLALRNKAVLAVVLRSGVKGGQRLPGVAASSLGPRPRPRPLHLQPKGDKTV